MPNVLFAGEETLPKNINFVGSGYAESDSRLHLIIDILTATENTNPANITAILGSILVDPFEQQKAAFHQIPPLIRSQYSGQWVVSRDGQIVDSDNDLQVLSRRFFDLHGDVDVYIAHIDQQITRVRTPFLR